MSAWLNHGDRLSLSVAQDRAARLGRQSQQWALRKPVQMRAGAGGWLLVNNAPVWLTLHGHVDDWVLQPGERLAVQRGQSVVAESWRADSAAELQWLPLAPAGQGASVRATGAAALAALRRALAAGLVAVAGALAYAAQAAEALARRARGGPSGCAAGPAPCSAS